MPTEIQWRLRKEGKKAAGPWQHHSMVAAAEADEIVKTWNDYSPVFEYRWATVAVKPPEKPPIGPFGFSFGNKGKRKPSQFNPGR